MEASELIAQIQKLQSRGSRYYSQGLFPSQRVHLWLPYQREDDNIFFSTLIAFTLQDLMSDLIPDDQHIAEDIIHKVRLNHANYQHWKGEGSFNFWRSNPSHHFPHGWILHNLDSFAIPDDADVSVLVHLTNDFSKKQTNWLNHKLRTHYALDQEVSGLAPVKYQHLRAYPTFFGKKILREMDACVICNVLYFHMQHRLSDSRITEDALAYLKLVLSEQDYLKRPFEIAPSYGNPAVILYHIARLAAKFDTESMVEISSLLKNALCKFDLTNTSIMEQLLVKTSMLRLNIKCEPININAGLSKGFTSFYFFYAGMLNAFERSWLQKQATLPFFHLKYRCEAYYWTLLLEHLLLTNRVHSKS